MVLPSDACAALRWSFPGGDFNADGVVHVVDIDLLSDADRSAEYNSLYDLDGNGILEPIDRQVWVEDAFGTRFGDANLDKTFAFADFLLLSNNYNMSGGVGRRRLRRKW